MDVLWTLGTADRYYNTSPFSSSNYTDCMNPIQFGMMMFCNLAIGMCTPPVGATLFAGCAVGKIPIGKNV